MITLMSGRAVLADTVTRCRRAADRISAKARHPAGVISALVALVALVAGIVAG